MSYKSVLMVAALLVLGACASLFNETTQNVTINSIPVGATVMIDGRSFTTPATVSLKGKSEYFFTVEKQGYKPSSGKVDEQFRVWTAATGNNEIMLEPLPLPPATLEPVPQPPAPLLQPLPLAPAGTAPAPAPTLR